MYMYVCEKTSKIVANSDENIYIACMPIFLIPDSNLSPGILCFMILNCRCSLSIILYASSSIPKIQRKQCTIPQHMLVYWHIIIYIHQIYIFRCLFLQLVYQADDSGIQIKQANCISQSQVDFSSTRESLFLLSAYYSSFIYIQYIFIIYLNIIAIYMTLFVQL